MWTATVVCLWCERWPGTRYHWSLSRVWQHPQAMQTFAGSRPVLFNDITPLQVHCHMHVCVNWRRYQQLQCCLRVMVLVVIGRLWSWWWWCWWSSHCATSLLKMFLYILFELVWCVGCGLCVFMSFWCDVWLGRCGSAVMHIVSWTMSSEGPLPPWYLPIQLRDWLWWSHG